MYSLHGTGMWEAGRIGPLGRVSPLATSPFVHRPVSCEGAQSRPYWPIFFRRVLRSMPRISAARVLLPPALARTLRI